MKGRSVLSKAAASRTFDGNALAAKRAARRRIGGNANGCKRMKRDAFSEARGPARNKSGDARHFSAAFAERRDDLGGRASGGHDVLRHEVARPSADGKAASKNHFSLLALGENEFHVKGARQLIADEHAAERGRGDGVHRRAAKLFGEPPREARRRPRAAQSERALHVLPAVEPARKDKVPRPKRALARKNGKDRRGRSAFYRHRQSL